MTGFSNYTAQAGLNWQTGLKAMPALPSVWLSLITAVGADDGTGFTEVSGNPYARVQVAGTATVNATTASGNPTLHFASTPTWITAGMTALDVTAPTVIPAGTTVLSVTGTTVTLSANATGSGVGAASGTGPSQSVNTAAIAFAQSTGAWGTLLAFGLNDALTSGNLLNWDFLGPYAWLPMESSAASPAVLTAKGHGYSAADNVVYSAEYGGTPPTFSQSNFTGLLTVVSPTTDTFTVTNGGTAVNCSTSGSGMVRKVSPQATVSNMALSFAAGQLTLVSA